LQVTCDRCSSKYRVSDDKLKGRKKIKLKCKKCANIIEAKVNIIGDEDTSSLFSTSSNENIGKVVKTEGDIFKDNLLSEKDSFAFDDNQKTLTLDVANKKKSTQKQPKFKSDFQMDFSEKNNQQESQVMPSGTDKAGNAVSFEVTEQLSLQKFNKYIDDKEKNSSHRFVADKSIDEETRGKFNDISSEFNSDLSSHSFSRGIIKSLIFIVAISLLLFIFILYRNKWKFNPNKFGQMTETAFGLKNNNIIKQKFKKNIKTKPLSKQFFIDGKKIKAKQFKISRRRRNKKHAFVISGEIKNIDNVKKSLTTVFVKVENILNNEVILKKRVYAGNFFTKKEIIKAKKSEVLDAEYLQSGKNGANWGVLPNKTINFMVVFYLKKKINIKKIKIKVEIKSTQ